MFALLIACGKDKSPPGPIQEAPKPKPEEPKGSGSGSLASRLAGSGSGSAKPADKPPLPVTKKVDGECLRKHADVALAGACEYRCSTGDAVACSIAATKSYGGDGVRQDDAKALTFALEACRLESSAGCSTAATLYAGFHDAKQKDPAKREEYEKKAYALMEKECAAGDPSACINHAYWLSGKVIGGIAWLPADEKAATAEYKHGFELREQACEDREGDQCEAHALDYELGGDGLDKNVKRAFEFRTKGCEALHATSCFELAEAAKDKDKTPLLEKACDQNYAKACLRLADAETANTPRQVRLADKACKLGQARPCLSMGEDAATKGDKVKARELFDRACELGLDSGCTSARMLPK